MKPSKNIGTLIVIGFGVSLVFSASPVFYRRAEADVTGTLYDKSSAFSVGPYGDGGSYIPGGDWVLCGLGSDSRVDGGLFELSRAIFCHPTPALAAAGMTLTGPQTTIDSATNGPVEVFCQTPPGYNYGMVGTGIAKWAKNGQLDMMHCTGLTGYGSFLGWTTILSTAPNTDYYCPPDSLMVGFWNSPGKNDSWGEFDCAQILLPSPAIISAIPASPSDNLPAAVNQSSVTTVGTDGNPLAIAMKNNGTLGIWGGQYGGEGVWRFDTQTVLSTSGDCDNTNYTDYYSDNNGGGNLTSIGGDPWMPALYGDITTGGYANPATDPIGSTCTATFLLTSSKYGLQHSGSFGTTPSLIPLQRTVVRTATSHKYYDPCYDTNINDKCVGGWGTDWNVSYNIIPYVPVGDTAPFNVSSLTAPAATGTYTETWNFIGCSPSAITGSEPWQQYSPFPPSSFCQPFTKTITVGSNFPVVTITANGTAGSITIPYNTGATIAWNDTNTSGADTCTVTSGGSPFGTGVSGSQPSGNLTTTTIYAISCSGPGGAGNSPQSVTVNVIQLAVCTVAGNPPPQTVTIVNSGGGTLIWTASADKPWLSVAPASGSLGAGASAPITASFDKTGLNPGAYTGTITVSGNAPSQTIPVTFTITP